MKKIFYSLAACAALLSSCIEPIPASDTSGDLVKTLDSEVMSYTSAVAKFSVDIKRAGNFTSFDAGVYVSPTLTEPDGDSEFQGSIQREKDGTPDLSGTYSICFDNLSENTTYYVRAWASFDGVISTGSVKTFTTPGINLIKDQLVDLGLSVKWSGWNLGATKPEESGDYYAWGETSPKDRYAWDTYRFGGLGCFTKYCTDMMKGTMDGRTVLVPSDDAATVAWGGKWRMPTMAEKHELLLNTTQCLYNLNGVDGYLFTSKVNGKSIFFPSAGIKEYGMLEGEGELCAFWTSTLNVNTNEWASVACNKMNDPLLSNIGWSEYLSTSFYLYYERFLGIPVRPVYGDNHATYSPVVSLAGVSGVLPYEASFEAAVEDLESCGKSASDVSEFGVCLSTTNSTPSYEDIVKPVGGALAADGRFNFKVTELPAETRFYCRAYAIVNGVCLYSSSAVFTTLGDISQIDPTAEIVDLGLSVKWAGWNIGATKPELFGDYIAWGETSSKSSFSRENYAYYSADKAKYTKYCSLSGLGTLDFLSRLETEDDAAYVNWGVNWRVPTSAQWDEIVQKAQWVYTIYNGVRGFVVKGSNGKAVFFPMSGIHDWDIRYEGSGGYYRGFYWSADLDPDSGSKTTKGVACCINNENIKFHYSYERYYGLTIRPVYIAD